MIWDKSNDLGKFANNLLALQKLFRYPEVQWQDLLLLNNSQYLSEEQKVPPIAAHGIHFFPNVSSEQFVSKINCMEG